MDEDLLEVARCIRFYLPELVETEAVSYDRQFARLLAAAHVGINVDDELSVVMRRSPRVQEWVAGTLEDELHRPPDVRSVAELGFEPLPGTESPVPAPKYCCPGSDYVWWRQYAGQPVPSCPTHGTLVPCS